MAETSRTRYSIVVDSVMATVVGSLVVGFFVVLWRGFEQHATELAATRYEVSGLREHQIATGEVLGQEVAKLRTGIVRLEEAVTALSRHAPEPTPGVEKFTEREPQSALEIQQSVLGEIYERGAKKREAKEK